MDATPVEELERLLQGPWRPFCFGFPTASLEGDATGQLEIV